MRKTASFDEQTMPKDKYLSIFLLQIEAIIIVSYHLNIFFAICTVLKIGEFHIYIPQF